jgi:hypothetical protein
MTIERRPVVTEATQPIAAGRRFRQAFARWTEVQARHARADVDRVRRRRRGIDWGAIEAAGKRRTRKR